MVSWVTGSRLPAALRSLPSLLESRAGISGPLSYLCSMSSSDRTPLTDLVASTYRDLESLGNDQPLTEALLGWLDGQDVSLGSAGKRATELKVKTPHELLYRRRR